MDFEGNEENKRQHNIDKGGNVTQKDVAKLAGVSPSVVSYVINNGPRPVSSSARRRVLEAISQLEYTPNRFAQQLMRDKWQSQDRRQLAVVMGGGADNLQRPIYASVLTGIFEEARQQERHVLSIQFLTDLLDPILFNTLVNSRDIFGIVLLALEPLHLSVEEKEVLDRLVSRFDNVISAERKWGELPTVTFDLQETGFKAANHFIGLGHRHIAYVGTQDGRLAGYQWALLEAGIEQNPALQFINPEHLNNYQFGYESAAKLIESQQTVTAICTASDEVAIGVLSYLCSNQIKVPEQIAIIGVDNVRQSKYTTPTLSTIQIPKVELGKQAVHMLIDRSKKPDSPPISHLLPTELIIRESCGGLLKP